VRFYYSVCVDDVALRMLFSTSDQFNVTKTWWIPSNPNILKRPVITKLVLNFFLVRSPVGDQVANIDFILKVFVSAGHFLSTFFWCQGKIISEKNYIVT